MIKWDERDFPLCDIKFTPDNPRRISKDAFERLKKKIEEQGYHQRIIVQPDLTICGGNQRLRALQELGITRVKVLVPDRVLTPEEYRKLVVTDNLSDGEWDMDILGAHYDIEELKDWGFPEKLLEFAPPPSDEAAEDLPPAGTPVTKLGDIWICGPHRIMCGDSTSADDVKALLRDDQPNLMVTDPPYGVDYDPEWRNRVHRSDGSIVGAVATGKVTNDHRSDWSEAWQLFPGNIAYVWHGGYHSGTVQASLESCGFLIRAQIIWAKNQFAIGRGDYHWQHEPCWYAVKNKGNWCGDRSQTTVWNIDKPQKSETGHSTQKPIECMRRPMINNSSPLDSVYDPFIGSGTSLIAAHQIQRIIYGMEISPAYCDIVVRRWQGYARADAVLESAQKTFNQLEKS